MGLLADQKDHFGSQNDSSELSRPETTALELFNFMDTHKDETNPKVWVSISACVERIGILLSRTASRKKFHLYVRTLFRPIFSKLTWEAHGDESDDDTMNRALVITTLINFEDQEVIKEAKRRYKAHINQDSIITADLRQPVYQAIAMHGDVSEFDHLFKLYVETDSQEEKNRIMRVLGTTRNPDRIKRIVDFALSDSVRNQDKVYMIIPLGKSSPPVAFQLLKDKKDCWIEKFANSDMIQDLVRSSTENFTSEARAKEVAEFFELNNFPGTEKVVKQSIENILLNARWLQRNIVDTIVYLNQKFVIEQNVIKL